MRRKGRVLDAERIRRILSDVRDEGRILLSEPESLDVLRGAGVPVVPTERAADPGEAAAAAERIGLPVVLKIVSADLPHKTEAGAVIAGLKTPEEVKRAAAEMDSRVRALRPEAGLQGFAVQPMAEGVETLASVTADPLFGPILAFGLGGVWVEVLEDVALRVAPVGPDDVDEMLGEIKGRKLLDGFRGGPSADRDALRETLLRLSDLACTFADDIAEVEINPLFAGPDGVLAADGLVRLHEARTEGEGDAR